MPTLGHSSAERPTAVPAQPAAALHDEHGGALGTVQLRDRHRDPCTRDQYLALAAAVPVDGDSLATQLVRELVRSFHVERARAPREVDGLADGSVDVPLKRGLHADVRADIDLVRGREPALEVGGHLPVPT